jgi:hypothetical protein
VHPQQTDNDLRQYSDAKARRSVALVPQVRTLTNFDMDFLSLSKDHRFLTVFPGAISRNDVANLSLAVVET